MFDLIKEDFKVSSKKDWSLFKYLLLCLSSKGVAAVKDYRLSHWFYKKGLYRIAKMVQNRNLKRHACEISCAADIGPGFAIGHPLGIVIGGGDYHWEKCNDFIFCSYWFHR